MTCMICINTQHEIDKLRMILNLCKDTTIPQYQELDRLINRHIEKLQGDLK